MSWTPERKELAAKLWNEGLSASEGAKRLGAPYVTRNAVIGLIHRAGLSQRQVVSKPLRRVVHVAPARPKPQMPKGVMVLAPQTGGDKATANRVENLQARANPSPDTLARARAFVPLEGRDPVPFGSKGCKWPVSSEGADMLQCGCERDGDKPYCATHAAAAYQPPKEVGSRYARSRRRYTDSGRAAA